MFLSTIFIVLPYGLALALPNSTPLKRQNAQITNGRTFQPAFPDALPDGTICNYDDLNPNGLWKDPWFIDPWNPTGTANIRRDTPAPASHLEPRVPICDIQGVITLNKWKGQLGYTSATDLLPGAYRSFELCYGFSRDVAKIEVFFDNNDSVDNPINTFKENAGRTGTVKFATPVNGTKAYFIVYFGDERDQVTDGQLALFDTSRNR